MPSAGIEPGLDELDRAEQLRQPLERVVLGLHRNDHAVGGGERVHGQRPVRGRAVEEDVAVAVAGSRERALEVALAVRVVGELDRGAGEGGLRGHELEVPEPRRPGDLGDRRTVEQVVARRPVRLLAQTGRGVRLRVEIDEQRPLARLGEAGGEIDGGRRLADAALLVRDRVDGAGHGASLETGSDYSRAVRDPAPPYRDEGPHALWHMSENPEIARFEPHVSATAAEREPLVWAVDTRHLPLYWFPRDCPRGTFWADAETTPEDAERLLGGSSRVHVIEEAWLDRMRAATVFAYRLPEERFEPHPEVGGYWISRDAVEPVAIEPRRRPRRPARAGRDRASRPAEHLAALERRRRLDARVQRHAAPQRAPPDAALGERPLLRDAGSAREAGRRRPGLPDRRGSPAGTPPARRRSSLQRERPRPSSADGPTQSTTRAALLDERQAPLRRDRRLRERLRDRDLVTVCCLALGAAPDDAQVRQLRPSSARGTRSCGARPRAASPRGPAATRRAGSPACRRRCRRRRSGPRSGARARGLRARRRAARAGPRPGPSARSGRASPARRRASGRGGQTSTWRG